jgi:hypothetical protein
MKGLILLLGEAFRGGGQHSRLIGSPRSLNGQMAAAQSHIEFIKYLETKHFCNIRVYIGTYKTQYNDKLFDVYKNHIIGSDLYEHRIGYNNLLHNSIKNIGNIQGYDFLLIMRIDLCLKDRFINIFNPAWQTIRFPTIHWECLPCGNPKTNDMIIFIPSKYYKYIEKILFRPGPNVGNVAHGHFIWSDLVQNTDLTNKDLDAMIETFHDSDSKKETNPLYYIVNREICKTHLHPGFYFDKNIHPERCAIKEKTMLTTKCKREDCFYMKHRNIKNNGGLYCCRSCRDGIGHGTMCEKITAVF